MMNAVTDVREHDTHIPLRINWPKALRTGERQALEPLLAGPIDYMDDPAFADRGLARRLADPAGDLPSPEIGWYYHLPHLSDPSDTTRLAATPLLTTEQEQDLFLRYNYARHRAEQIRQRISLRRVSARKARELLRWHQRAIELREKIAEYNVALVLAMARRFASHRVDLTEIISEGNMALLRAIDKFDVARGFKFSTYACRSILKAFSRHGEKSTRHQRRFISGTDFEADRSTHDQDKSIKEEQSCAQEVKAIFQENRSQLSEVEHQVIAYRFFTKPEDGSKQLTLEQVGHLIGLTKERVRQIQNKALAKLRHTLEATYLDGPSIDMVRLNLLISQN